MVIAAGCSDKDEYAAVETSTPLYTSMTYSTQLSVSRQTTNRKEVYRINGNFVKLSVEWNETDDYYTLRADKWADAGDKATDKILDCQIAELEGEYANATDVNIAKVLKNDELNYQPSVVLPETDTEKAKENEDDPNAWISTSHPAYVVRYVDEANKLYVYLIVRVDLVTKTESVVEEVIPKDEPFGEDTTVENLYYSVRADVSYKAFNSHGWIN